MEPIFEYTDYREWLRDAFDDFKKRKSVISWRYMAMKLGADPGNLLRVSQGKIHLTLSLVQPMAEFFELSEKETAYWTELVYFGRAKTDAEALNHYEKMQMLKGIPLKRLAKKELEFYRHWYCNAIRSIIGICKFKDDYEGLAESCTPAISVEEAKNAVKLLYDLNMISRDRDGFWKVNDTFVSTGGNWRSEAVRTFQKETVRLAGESLTFNMDDIALIREKIKEFRSELLRMSQEGTGDDTVFQLNVQLFPIGFAKKLQGGAK